MSHSLFTQFPLANGPLLVNQKGLDSVQRASVLSAITSFGYEVIGNAEAAVQEDIYCVSKKPFVFTPVENPAAYYDPLSDTLVFDMPEGVDIDAAAREQGSARSRFAMPAPIGALVPVAPKVRTRVCAISAETQRLLELGVPLTIVAGAAVYSPPAEDFDLATREAGSGWTRGLETLRLGK